MKSLKELFIQGPGPSSSHTIGPYKAALAFKKEVGELTHLKVKVILFGSLAFTGMGHGTADIIKKGMAPFETEVIFDYETITKHPNTVKFSAYDEDNSLVLEETYESIGGGAIKLANVFFSDTPELYPFSDFQGLNKFMTANNLPNYGAVIDFLEDSSLNSYLDDCLSAMFDSIEEGITASGFLCGKLKLQRGAKDIYLRSQEISDSGDRRILRISSYAYAVAENNAAGANIVTAPTCGAAGVLPAVLYYFYKDLGFKRAEILESLKVGGLIGNFVKTEASISGAVAGCQAEIGTASAMSAAALCYLNHLSPYQIEYGAEVALEHFLGLTCDPVGGYVAIPCIERNGVASLNSYDAFIYARDIAPTRKNRISFKEVVRALKITGESLSSDYKETSLGGLAKVHNRDDE